MRWDSHPCVIVVSYEEKVSPKVASQSVLEERDGALRTEKKATTDNRKRQKTKKKKKT